MSTEGTIIDGETVVYQQPQMEGVQCEVQHSLKSGKPMTKERGIMGVGVVTLPTGQPRLIVQIKHPDGTSLSATLMATGALTMVDCLIDAMTEAQRLSEAADAAKRRPS